MNIKGVSQTNINAYHNVSRKKIENKQIEGVKDKVEISAAAKTLQSYGIEELKDNTKRIEEIKKQLTNGTYKPTAKAISRAMYNVMKGKDF